MNNKTSIIQDNNDLEYKSLNDGFIEKKTFSSFSKNSTTKWDLAQNKTLIFKLEEINISVFDVADFILKSKGTMTTMKLHKLLYYCQAWSLVWDETPLFHDKIEAWANGPVIKKLFSFHRGLYTLSNIQIGNQNLLSEVQKETINEVLNYYGEKSAQWLIELTHMEDPWRKARKGLDIGERSYQEITLSSIAEYYSSL